MSWIIYLADLSKLSKGTVCLVNLDEPQDPGVLIEVMYAKQLNIPTIGYRCDSRTPFGAPKSWNFGMHFFPLFQCDHFIQLQNVNTGSVEEADKLILELATKVDTIMREKKQPVTNQTFDDIRKVAAELIPDVRRLSDIPLQDMVSKYMGMREKLEKMEPIIHKLPSTE